MCSSDDVLSFTHPLLAESLGQGSSLGGEIEQRDRLTKQIIHKSMHKPVLAMIWLYLGQHIVTHLCLVGGFHISTRQAGT